MKILFFSWNSVVASSAKLMKRLSPKYVNCHEFTSILNAEVQFKNRPYRKLNLQNRANGNFERIKLKGILMAYGHQIDTLQVSMSARDDLLNLLPFMKNLTSLKVDSIVYDAQIRGPKVDLFHLEELQISINDSDIINCIGTHKIKKLLISGSDHSPERAVKWKKFLASCDSLEELNLSHWYDFKLIEFNLRLTKFELGNETFLFEELRTFLKSQVATLKVLRAFVGGDTERNDEFFAEFAAFDMNLETFDYRPGVNLEMREQRVNTSLKKLDIFADDYEDVPLEHYRKFFFGLKGVESLTIFIATNEDYDDFFAVETLNLLTVSMSKLRALKVSFFDGLKSDAIIDLNMIRIEQVQEIYISCLINEQQSRAAILTMCPNVKKYTCNRGKISSADMAILVGAHKDLEEVYAREVELNDKVIDMILASKIRKIGIEKKLDVPEKLKYSKTLIYKLDADWFESDS